ncbi:3-phosphoshikimate 1-carboxyvinyltransferase [Limosilactobacillus difficilis]|uniref:3-phosphoshikimate 1-carboxyvinyltransferase n=1 Tax=Limosilactobacillus difficilis TaxID=2991838 RepID=UPI0024BB32BD|nr:3-phosphoshikimate 1-carboxyvinyltransferase [Limosilactobacillus difficilis]
MTRIQLSPAPAGLHGQLRVPGDKSISHRAVMLGALSKGRTTIDHFLLGQDCQHTIEAFRQLGVPINMVGDTVTIHGVGLTGLRQPAQALQMGNSGTTTRLMMGILAGQDFDTELVGDPSLSKRPMKRVSQPLSQFGARVLTSEGGTLPSTVVGQPLHAADVQLAVASAQVKSALIFAALQANGESTIREKLPTRDHTELMLRQFGADIQSSADRLTITVQPHPVLRGQHVLVPGDISSAAFFLAGAAITPHSSLTLQKVNLNPTRTGIIHVLQKMGAQIDIQPLASDGEPLGDITIQSSQLRSIDITATDVPAMVDELPLVALLAARAHGTSTITGASELRVKETDRIQTVTTTLRQLGVQVKELPDGWQITGRDAWKLQDPVFSSFGDHRLGMLVAIAALTSPTALSLDGAEAIDVSYPGFLADLRQISGGDQQ